MWVKNIVNGWRNTLFSWTIGFAPSCPDKFMTVLKKYSQLLMWAPVWIATLIVWPVRLLMLIIYFFIVTNAQVVASISAFFIGIKNWFDSIIYGDFYHAIKWIWNNPFVFMLFFGIFFLALLFLFAIKWVFDTAFEITWNIFVWMNALFFDSFWWMIN